MPPRTLKSIKALGDNFIAIFPQNFTYIVAYFFIFFFQKTKNIL